MTVGVQDVLELGAWGKNGLDRLGQPRGRWKLRSA